MARPGRGTRDGIACVFAHWSELVTEPFACVVRELGLGRSVLLVADERVPMLADALVFALLDAGVDGERIALLHGLTHEAQAHALADERVRAVHAGGDRATIARLRGACQAGAVVEQRLRLLRTSAVRVEADEEPRRAARAVLGMAFGHGRTLFGQRAGQVGRVHCAARLFSRFTEALLVELEDGDDWRPAPLVDREALREVRRRWAEGLDEGATLVSGGSVVSEMGATVVRPTVFTNLEPHMNALRRQAPMPILSLIRS